MRTCGVLPVLLLLPAAAGARRSPRNPPSANDRTGRTIPTSGGARNDVRGAGRTIGGQHPAAGSAARSVDPRSVDRPLQPPLYGRDAGTRDPAGGARRPGPGVLMLDLDHF